MKGKFFKSNAQKIAMEDALKEVYSLQEEKNGFWELANLIDVLGVTKAYSQDIAKALVDMGWAKKESQDRYHLTQLGNERAVELIRAHRLWEQYLASHKGLPLEALHAEAHQREHSMSTEEIAALDDALGHPVWDPHGHAIPDEGVTVLPKAGNVLSNTCVPGSVLRVVAVDDHPEELLAQFVVLGIIPGAKLTIVELNPHDLEIKVGNRIFPLAFSAAQHIFVVPVTESPVPLGQLETGQSAQILELQGKGKLQRRLLSMGFVPGAIVSIIRQAPFGDPVQYRIKKSNIALRRKEANVMLVRQY
jgi:Fe2+ transport system protein FeoA/Mn-dependent DtxR family transcriptional regulator